jgi:hypothetical protein
MTQAAEGGLAPSTESCSRPWSVMWAAPAPWYALQYMETLHGVAQFLATRIKVTSLTSF